MMHPSPVVLYLVVCSFAASGVGGRRRLAFIPAPAPAPLNATSSPVCRLAQDVIASQCKQLFQEAIDDSRTGNLTTVSAEAVLKKEQTDNPRPTSGCCIAIEHYLKGGCRCDGFVEQQTRAQNITAGGLAAARVYFATACGLSLALDAAPPACPGEPLVPAADLLSGG